MCHTFSIDSIVSAFTTTTSTIIHPLGEDAVLRQNQDILRQFTLLHVAQCQDKGENSLILFSVYCFWATECASTRDNRYNCALPTRTELIHLNKRDVKIFCVIHFFSLSTYTAGTDPWTPTTSAFQTKDHRTLRFLRILDDLD